MRTSSDDGYIHKFEAVTHLPVHQHSMLASKFLHCSIKAMIRSYGANRDVFMIFRICHCEARW